MQKKVLVGMSGGIDSAVAAAMLCESGAEVTGCYLCLTEQSGPDTEDARSAKQAADRLGIPLIVADHRRVFSEKVVSYFTSEYLAGRTPNPCVRCNPAVKAAALCEEADKLGIPYIATGHYAQTEKTGEGVFLTASPSKKDQSYFLYRLTKEQLARIEFPLGGFSGKEEIRAKGRLLGFEASEKPDSLEICFIPDNDYAAFICRSTGYVSRPGDFLDIRGQKIGKHDGIIRYTVGQRKGLGAFGSPRYVRAINAADNTVTLCTAEERFADRLTASDLVVHADIPENEPLECGVKIRSTALPQSAEIVLSDGKMLVRFASPVIAPTPGQSAVAYLGQKVIAGGIIE